MAHRLSVLGMPQREASAPVLLLTFNTEAQAQTAPEITSGGPFAGQRGCTLSPCQGQNGNPGLVTMFRVVVLGPVAKEGLFRGLLLHRWAVKWNLTAALWTSSILFGIAHTSTSVIGNTVFGLVMAILYLETGSLLVPVVVHAANNAIGCLRLWALPVAWNSVADIRDLLWLGILLLVVSAPLMLLYFSKHWPRKSVSLPYFRTATYSAEAGNPEGLSQI